MKGHLLIIDDDQVFCSLLQRHFAEEYTVVAFSDPEAAVRFIRTNTVDVVLTDLNMPKIDGMEILQTIKARSFDTDVIVMTAYAGVDTAVEAMKMGAYDYVVKPFSVDEISLHLKNLFEKRRLAEENRNLRKYLDTQYKPENIIGKSQAMADVRRFIERVPRTEATALITGESGTGKHFVAGAIHFTGKRKGQGFISVHCGDMLRGDLESRLFGHEGGTSPTGAGEPKRGFFEEANGGTLVLGEIGDMDVSLQAKLLGVLENGTIQRMGGSQDIPLDVMVIATSNQDLGRLQQEGKFRSDLFYRLSMFNFRIPPLRDRREDISPLAEHFFSQYKNEFQKPGMQLSRKAVEALQNHTWPGNVRELKNFFAKLCLLEDSQVILPKHVFENLPEPQDRTASLLDSGRSLDDVEKNLILETLEKTRWNVAMASRRLNISYDTLRYRMKKLGLRQKSDK